MACETLVTTGLAIVAGEITTSCLRRLSQDVVRETIKEIGYTRAKFGFDAETCAVLSSIHEPVARHRAWASTPAAPATRA